ncbi:MULTISPECIES: nicotinamide riboside transporter PnuC [unclassified Microbacterium]|uniref:nicotinamide riboside transporter PnuC n=1 Tax=unclassified Microbacterium TaxID=2609290 RepID=UPI00214C2A64|nr:MULTISPECIES: nicotinamide riboside transporter PnuC [unclassified Microbacterium]MCR2783738.1 nicotinamide riboside transporter PnuC [Microbacterium sp. zg.B96]WIM15409.1 nicotinamide riboside transporter PnuC [Microbacterium sp. zg-B96]
MIEWILAEWMQILGFATGAACVLLSALRNVWTYPLGIANNLVFLAVFLPAGLYASAALQVVYLALGIHGWFRWTRRVEHDRHYIARTPRRAIVWLVVAGVALAAVLTWVLSTFTDSQVALADAATTSASLVAQYMLNRKWLENWFVWIGVDIAFVALSIVTGLWIVAALYVLFVALCIFGWRSWRRVQGETPATDPEPHAVAARA